MPIEPPETYTHPPIDCSEIYCGLLIFMVKSTAVWGTKLSFCFSQAAFIVNKPIAQTMLKNLILLRIPDLLKNVFSILTVTLILIFCCVNVSAQDAPSPKRQKTEKISKWEKKARKQEAKADRIKKRLIKKQQSAKKPSNADIRKMQRKIEARADKAAGYRYKGKSISHAKGQTKKARKRMKKSLKKHRKHKRDH